MKLHLQHLKQKLLRTTNLTIVISPFLRIRNVSSGEYYAMQSFGLWMKLLFSYQIPIPKNPLLRLGEKIQILIWICRLSTSLIRLPLFYCLFKWRLAPAASSLCAWRDRGPAQNKNMHQQSWCGGRAACNKFHACAKESYYIARRVPQDLTKSEGLAFKIFTFFLLCAYKQGFLHHCARANWVKYWTVF